MSISRAISAGETLSAVVTQNAESACPGFFVKTQAHVLQYLRDHGESSSEDITDSCKKVGIVPHDDRAFGSVFAHLAKKDSIRSVGFCLRRKGHGTSGGRIWSLV